MKKGKLSKLIKYSTLITLTIMVGYYVAENINRKFAYEKIASVTKLSANDYTVYFDSGHIMLDKVGILEKGDVCRLTVGYLPFFRSTILFADCTIFKWQI